MRRIGLHAAAGLLATASAASADSLTINLNFEFSGATAPSGSGPWARAEFSSTTAGQVDLKLTSLLNGDAEKITMWTFNLDEALDADDLSISHVSGQGADAILTGTNDYKADGDGYFDIRFDFPNSGDTFGMGEMAEFKITGPGITASSFAFLSVNGPPSKNGFMSAAHVQGIGAGGGLSGWIAPGGETPPATVPLPAPLALGAAGLGLAAGVRVVTRRK
ncbi:MAG: hypothetical protein ACF8R7_01670 [Phycisphaerales bacterium JB039]